MSTDPEVAAAIKNGRHHRNVGWKTVARGVIVLVVAAALLLAVKRSMDHWNAQSPESRLRWDEIDYRWLLVSAGLYAAALLPATMVLSRALTSLGATHSLRHVVAAQLLGHLGKYVPGKAMVILIRAAVLNRGGSNVSLRAATIAIMIETLTMISTGAMLALVVLLFREVPLWMKQVSAFMAVAAGISTSPPLLNMVMARRFVGGMLPFEWTHRDMAVAWFWNALGWFLLGASLAAIMAALPRQTLEPHTTPVTLYLICLASITLAYVAGFLSLLPGGAGVRELVLTTMLASVAGPSGALVAAILVRMIHLVVEVVLSGLAWTLVYRVVSEHAELDAPASSG